MLKLYESVPAYVESSQSHVECRVPTSDCCSPLPLLCVPVLARSAIETGLRACVLLGSCRRTSVPKTSVPAMLIAARSLSDRLLFSLGRPGMGEFGVVHTDG